MGFSGLPDDVLTYLPSGDCGNILRAEFFGLF